MTLSSSQPAVPIQRIGLLTVAYSAAYLGAAWLDLATTALALTRSGASEGNVYATDAHAYAAIKAWLITAAGGIVVVAFLLFGALNAGRVGEIWLSRPMRSFARFYVNPFAPAVIDRSPLHALSWAVAFVPLRLLAAANNVLIWKTGTAPLGWLVGVASNATTPLVGFWLVMGTLYCLLAVAAAPMAARLIRWLRQA
jgi:hypothetical protein